MNDFENDQTLLPDLTQVAQTVSRLAQDDLTFRAFIDAYRAEDADTFAELIRRHDVAISCELLCRWIAVKECTHRCVILCGPLPERMPTIDEIPDFARLLVKITADEELVEELADAVNELNGERFRKLIAGLQAERYCHLLCHWVCTVRERLRCEVVCGPRVIVARPHFVDELIRAGAALKQLLEKPDVLGAVLKESMIWNCERVQVLLTGFHCHLICEWICSWRCVLVCLPLIRPFGNVTFEPTIEEMREFASALGVFREKPELLARLVDAVGKENADAFTESVKAAGLERHVLQLCHWICRERCVRWCRCVCPPGSTIPLFTHVGIYRVPAIWNDFTPDGTTTAGDLAFTGTIPLRGVLPDGSAPDALEYHFQTQKYAPDGVTLVGTPVDVTDSMIPATVIGVLEYYAFLGGLWQVVTADYTVNNPGATIMIPQQVGPDLGPVSVNTNVKPGGWIEVPRENALSIGGTGRFIPTGTLANLDTTKLTLEHFDLRPITPPLPLKAGDSVSPAQRSEKPHFRISFEARRVGSSTVSANALEKIALSNTQFDYVRHLDWAGYTVTSGVMVLSLDIAELIAGGGCVPLHNDVHALYTAYHPYLGSARVYLEGPGVPPPAQVIPSIDAGGQALSPAGGDAFDIRTLTPCAYILWVKATLRLTSGNGGVYGEFEDHIAFCVTDNAPM